MNSGLRRVGSIEVGVAGVVVRSDYWITSIGTPVKKPDGTVTADIHVHIDGPRIQSAN